MRWLTLTALFALPGCFIGSAEHQDRLDELRRSDTDGPDDTDDTDVVAGAPVIASLEWKFHFDSFNLYDGVALLVEVTDDAPLDDATLVIDSLANVPFSEALPLSDDHYLIPIGVDLGSPCATPTPRNLVVAVRDADGDESLSMSVDVGWTHIPHDESGITSADQCEPCVSNQTPDAFPITVCGAIDFESTGYFDFYDAVQVLVPGGDPTIRATVNYQNVVGALQFGVIYPPNFDWVYNVNTSNDIGHQILAVPPASPTLHEFDIQGAEDIFDQGEWVLFLEQAPPPPPETP